MANMTLGYRALTRFGLGPRGDDDIAAAARDPRGLLKAELADPGLALLDAPGLVRSADAAKMLFARVAEVKRESERKPDMPAMGPAAAPAPPPQKPPPTPEGMVFRAEAFARIKRAAEAKAGFVERLVAFWSNHFAVSAAKSGFLRVTAGPFEREAIRPHVLGRFADMLAAVERHPAMLAYLDNNLSIGPDSPAGKNRRRGLNENLAREILELHTLGVGGGYRQADVIALANMLTGWAFVGAAGVLGEPGAFVFNVNTHQPGPQTMMGRVYPAGGVGQAEGALADLARHPATARFVATKLVRHFVADEPPPALVETLARTFRDTEGDLRAVSLALVDSDAAWSAPPTKLRSPWEFLVAAWRLTRRPGEDPGPILGWLTMLGQPLWQPAAPNGFSDLSADWATPENLKLRLDVAARLAERVRDLPDPRDILERSVGAAASEQTRMAIARAESRQQGLALLLMSPEMQRR